MIAARIHAFLRAGGPRQGNVRVGPFLVRLTPGTTASDDELRGTRR